MQAGAACGMLAPAPEVFLPLLLLHHCATCLQRPNETSEAECHNQLRKISWSPSSQYARLQSIHDLPTGTYEDEVSEGKLTGEAAFPNEETAQLLSLWHAYSEMIHSTINAGLRAV